MNLWGADNMPGRASDHAEQPPAADALQRPLVPRSRFRARLRRSVRLHVDSREQLTEGVGHRGEPMRKKLSAVFVVIALAILALTHPAGAQQAGNMPRIGFLASGSAQTDAVFAHAFSAGLREHGWVEGQNIAIE